MDSLKDLPALSAASLWQQGFACVQRQQYAAGIALYKQALQRPGRLSVELLLYLAEAYKLDNQLWLAAEAINEACRLLELEGGQSSEEFRLSLRMRQGEYNRLVGRLDKALEGYSRAAELYGAEKIWAKSSAYGSYLLTFACRDASLEAFRQAVYGYDRLMAEDMGAEKLPVRRRRPSGKIRVGYMSGDFRQHVMFAFYYIMLAGYDKNSFHVICYSLSDHDDGYTEHLQGLADGWRPVAGCSLEELARQIAEDEIDILVDLSGHSAGSGLPVFALRPAPVQISGLGWMETTGFRHADYLITDACLDGKAEAYQSYLRERPLFLTSQFCYVGRQDVPEPKTAPCEKNGSITFGSFNSYHKITAAMVAVWSRILQKVPGAKLFLKCQVFIDARVQAEVKKRFALHGIAAERLILEAATADYMERYLALDIALDTYPYTGGGTTLDALYMGVPVVSLYGRRRGSRFGLSILTNAGLPELAVDSEEAYISRAVALAQDRELLNGLHLTLRRILRGSQVMNGKKYMAELESRYRQLMADGNFQALQPCCGMKS